MGNDFKRRKDDTSTELCMNHDSFGVRGYLKNEILQGSGVSWYGRIYVDNRLSLEIQIKNNLW